MKSPFSPKKPVSDTRQHTRLPMKPLHKICLQLTQNGMYFKIVNISTGGIGFLPDGNPTGKEESSLTVQLTIDSVKFKTDIEIIHRDNGVFGCKFKNPDPQLLKAIENYFSTELAALKVSMVETRREEGTEGKTLFFRGQNNCELLIQEIDGVLQHFNIILFGNYLEGDGLGNLCIGEKIDSKTLATPSGVQLFRPVHQADRHLIDSALRFIDGVEGLSETRKMNLVKILTASETQKRQASK